MLRCNLTFIPVLIILAILIGCSGSTPAPIILAPPIEVIDETRETDSQRALWGVWNIRYDLTDMSISVEPARNAQPHFNITNMIIPPACDDCLEISANSFDPVTRIIDVDVILRNPHAITGYDVRGILYTNDYGHLLTNALGWTKLFDVPGGMSLNPFKGFYTGPDPAAFGPHEERTENYLVYIPMPPAYSQITFAVDASWPTQCKEPYGISFFSHDPLHDYVGATAQAQVSVFDWQDDVDGVTLVATEITGEAFSSFTYGAGPIWQIDIVNNENAPAGDYEARIIATSTGSGETALYQYVTITIDEWDGPIVTGIDPDTAEPEDAVLSVDVTGSNFAGPGALVKLIPESGPVIAATEVIVIGPYNITCEIQIPQDAYVGMYDVEVTNGDSTAGAGIDLFEVTCPMPVVTGIDPDEAFKGDALTNVTIGGDNFWGTTAIVKLSMSGEPDIVATNVAVDDYNTINCDITIPNDARYGMYSVVVTNGCDETGQATDIFEVFPLGWVRTGFSTPNERGMDLATDKDGNCHVVGYTEYDAAFYIIYDSTGDIVFEAEWGDAANHVIAFGIALDAAGNVYIAGRFIGDVDLDPDAINEDLHTTNGFYDAFLVSLDSSGAFRWGLSWGGSNDDFAYDVALQSNRVCVCGLYSETVDFDPDPIAEYELKSNGGVDAYLSRFDLHGEFSDVSSWGDTGYDTARSVATYNDDIYVTGIFGGTVDLDPRPANEEIRTSVGSTDAYVSKFDSTGTFKWVGDWGGTEIDLSKNVAANSTGVYIGGSFRGSVIFDPKSTDPADEIDSNGDEDIYLTHFLHNGQYVWTDTFGGTTFDDVGGVSVDPVSEDILLTGYFTLTVDFDPGPGINEITSIGGGDAFMCRLDSDGHLVWVSTWGGIGEDYALFAASDDSGEFIFVTGYFSGTADFDPGPDFWPETTLGACDFFLMRMTSAGTW